MSTRYTEDGKLDLSSKVDGVALFLEEFSLLYMNAMCKVKRAESKIDVELSVMSGKKAANQSSHIAQLGAEFGFCPINASAEFHHVNAGIVSVEAFAEQLQQASEKLNLELDQSISKKIPYVGNGQGSNRGIEDLVAAREEILLLYEDSIFSEGEMTVEDLKIVTDALYRQSFNAFEVQKEQTFEQHLNSGEWKGLTPPKAA